MPETCIVGILVRLTSARGYDAARLDSTVEYLLDQQLTDGGWNTGRALRVLHTGHVPAVRPDGRPAAWWPAGTATAPTLDAALATAGIRQTVAA